MDWLSEFISRYGMGVGLLAVFVGGLTLNLTPCVYPMIPVTLAFFSGQAVARPPGPPGTTAARPGFSEGRAGRAGGDSVRRAVTLAFLYVLGISLNYALLGLIAAKTGALLGSWLQQPIVILAITAVMVALALSMFGLYELRPPQRLTSRFGQASAGGWGAFVMGVVVGLVAAPCIGPFVLGLLLLASQLANPLTGFLLFFVLGLGMGLPYVILAVAANRVGQLPKAGSWLVWSKKLLGTALLGVALYFLKPLLPGWTLRVAVVALLLSAGFYLGWLERTPSQGPWFPWVRRLMGATLMAAAVVVLVSRPEAQAGVAWMPYSDEAFAQAQRAGRPILIDIYADWCLPCVEMEHVTFRHPDVVRALAAAHVETLRVDATRAVPAEAQALLSRFRIYGAPTILFFGREGQERRELRLLGFADPKEFLQMLERLLSPPPGLG